VMRSTLPFFLTLLSAAVGLAVLGAAGMQERERKDIPEQYTWDLSPLYGSEAAWRKAKEEVEAEIPRIRQFEGKLGESAARLQEALETISGSSRRLGRLYVYASLVADQDTRESKGQAMTQEMTRLASTFAAEAAYVEPEILKMSRDRIAAFIQERPGLKPYEHYLDDILRRQPHTGTESEERLIAQAGMLASTPSDIYGIFSDADFPYPSVTLADGRTVKLNSSAYNLYRALPNREDRKKVMSAFFGALGGYRRTFGATMNATVQRDLFYMRGRKYASSLEAALNEHNIPVSVYHNLVEGVNESLPTFHRYLRLRKRMMGVDELHYYDLYAPLVGSVDLDYPVAQAQAAILEALAPLGREYTTVLQRAFAERWIDVYPNAGKRSGAYSNAAYDVHPYILMNYNDKYADMGTLAHELGHTMHSFYSNRAQPYPKADYPIFVAEVASTFNEALLIDHVLKRISDRQARLAILGNFLENIKGTVFRQTQFAEFELRVHEMAEKGEPLTGDSLSELYAAITKKYYGHDAKVCVVDDYVAHEWAFIPHFYRAFYVYQYATSFTASAAISERVLAGDAAAREKFLRFLASGGSDYPIALLQEAGVNVTTREPLRLTMQQMNRVMDEMEKMLQ